MKDLINKLKGWKADIDYDINHSNDENKKFTFISQSISLASAIGLLENIIPNNSNIPE